MDWSIRLRIRGYLDENASTLPHLADAGAVTRSVQKVQARVSIRLVFQPAIM